MTYRRGDIYDARKNGITNTGRDKSRPYILIAITFLIYLNSLPNDFIFDDIPLIQNSMNVINMGFWDLISSYRPLRYLSFAFDYRVFGMNPWGFRLMNIFYHSITVISVFWMLKVFGLSKRAAFISSILFAIHPVNTDAVAYISGRRDILMGLFYVLSVGWFIKFYNSAGATFMAPVVGVDPCINPKKGRSMVLPLLLSLIFMFFSISSKEMGATIPLIFIIYIFYKDGAKLLENKWVYISIMSFLLLFTFFVFITISGGGSGLVSLHGIYFHGNSPEVHYLTASTIWLHYLKLTIFPLKLILDNANYPLVTEWNFLVFFSVLSIFAYGWVVWRLMTFSQLTPDPSQTSPQTPLPKERGLKLPLPLGKGLGERFHDSRLTHHAIAFFLVFFVISLAPVLQIIPLHEIVAVHYLYVPVIGFCAVVGMLVDLTINPSQTSPRTPLLKEKGLKLPVPSGKGLGERSKGAVIGFLLLLLAFFSIRTITRNFELRDHWTVFHADEKWATLSFRGYFTLGAIYVDMKFPDKAAEYYKRSFDTGSWDGNLLSNMIGLYVLKGDHDSAVAFYESAKEKSEFITSNGILNTAVLYMLKGDCREALRLVSTVQPSASQMKRVSVIKNCEKYDFGKYEINNIKDIYNKQLQMKELGLEIERKPYLRLLIDLTLNPLNQGDGLEHTQDSIKSNSTPQPPSLSGKEGVAVQTPFTAQETLELVHELAVVNLQSDIPEAIRYYRLEKELYQKLNRQPPEIVEKSISALEDYSHKVLVEGKYYKMEW